MSKLPHSAHRSISVRQQPSQQALSRLQKSASTYGVIDYSASTPVEIGSKGSIFSLVNRDIAPCSQSADSTVFSPSKKKWNYVWHSRLWLMPRKTNRSRKHTLVGIETVAESARQTKTSKWKRLLKKLAKGSAQSKGNGSIKHEEKAQAPLRHDDKSRRDTTIPAFTPPQTSNAPTSLIWERRSSTQISPLDFSHLHTARIKKEHARLR